MAALSPAQLAQLVSRAIPDATVSGSGLSRWDTAYAVARAESGGRPEAVGDGGNSFGLWQIYIPAHPQYGASWLADPRNNATAMAVISNAGWSFTPWCTWDRPACNGAGNGAYRAYLAEARAALAPYRAPAPAPPPDPIPVVGTTGAAWILLVAGGAALLVGARKS